MGKELSTIKHRGCGQEIEFECRGGMPQKRGYFSIIGVVLNRRISLVESSHYKFSHTLKLCSLHKIETYKTENLLECFTNDSVASTSNCTWHMHIHL